MDEASAFSFDMSYCGSPPTMADLWSRWNFDPVLILGLALVAVFGIVTLRQSTLQRKLGFFSAWTLAAVLFVSPLCALTVALYTAMTLVGPRFGLPL